MVLRQSVHILILLGRSGCTLIVWSPNTFPRTEQLESGLTLLSCVFKTCILSLPCSSWTCFHLLNHSQEAFLNQTYCTPQPMSALPLSHWEHLSLRCELLGLERHVVPASPAASTVLVYKEKGMCVLNSVQFQFSRNFSHLRATS